MNKQESLADSTDPTAVDITFSDAFILLHSLQDIPNTYGEIDVMILCQLCNMSSRVDFICDKYMATSINTAGRSRRGENDKGTTVSQVQIKQGQNIGNVHYDVLLPTRGSRY